MDIATALTAKLNEDARSANLVGEVSNRLVACLGTKMQEQMSRTPAIEILARAQEQVEEVVDFYRHGHGSLPPMNENALGKFLSFTEDAIFQALLEQFQVAFAVVQNKRAQVAEAKRVVELIR
jgi:hypothetical protein